MEDTNQQFAHIKGWGIDADPKNDPTYPMKNRQIAIKRGYSWNRPEQQPINQEVLHSIERPNVTSVFGTSVPPSGLSGAIRRFAFTQSENSYLHWLPLILADRVNEVEGIVEDIKEGHVPNIFAEKGWKAKWKHNPEGLILNVALSTAIATAFIVYMTKGKKNTLHNIEEAISDTAHDIGQTVKDKSRSVVKSAKDHLPNIGGTKDSVDSDDYSYDDSHKRVVKRDVKYVPVERVVLEGDPEYKSRAMETEESTSSSKGWLSQLVSAVIPALIK